MGEHFYGETVFAGELNEVIVILYNTHTHTLRHNTHENQFSKLKNSTFSKKHDGFPGIFFYGDVIFGRLKKTLLPQAKTHVFFKESLLKLNLHRSRLYEQLRRRPNQHFAQNYILYANGTLKLAPDCKNRRKMRTQKMRAPGARNTEECLYTLHYTLFR